MKSSNEIECRMKRIHHRGAEAQRKRMFLNLRDLRCSFLNIEYRMKKLTGRSGKRQGEERGAWMQRHGYFHALRLPFVIRDSLFIIRYSKKSSSAPLWWTNSWIL